MRIKFYILSLLSLFITSAAIAQTGGVKGTVVNRDGRVTIENAKVTIYPGEIITYTKKGEFFFQNIGAGDYTMTIEAADFQTMQMGVKVTKELRDLGNISLTIDKYVQNVDELEFAEFDSDDGFEGQGMSSVLSASKDVYDNIAGFKFGQMRFRQRGYNSETQGVYLNGIYFNDAINGYTPWSLWSGLNDATRDQEHVGGLEISDYGVGGINGTTNINARASQIRQGYRFSFVNASAQYRFRVMASYGSGLLDNGWSYAFTFSTRQGGNEWVKGVYYNNWAYFGSVEKRINPHHTVGFTFFGTPGERAVQGGSTQEAYDLVGSNYYNPNWGYQGGTGVSDRRSARVRRTHEPVAMLNYSFEPSTKFDLQAAVSFRFGQNGYSALDWHNAPDPRPDYYRYLPSYYDNLNPDYNNPEAAAGTEWGWDWSWGIRQIDWDRLYEANRGQNFDDMIDRGDKFYNGVNPAGKRRSVYALEERRQDQLDFNAKLQTNLVLSNNSKMSIGYDFRYNRTEFYKKMKDLLGGDYWLDIDNFADRDFPGAVSQNNLDTPNRLVEKGDKYGYDYYAHLYQDRFWTTYRFNSGKWSANAGLEVGHTRFYREGRFRKGMFPENSQGKSREQNFMTYTVKAGVAFRPRGNQMIYANFANMHVAPHFQNAFVSPRARNTAVSNLKNEKILSVDLNYSLNLPAFKLRVTGFYTEIKDKSQVFGYYDDEARTFSNLAMTGIDQQHAGMELGAEVPIYGGLSGRVAFSYGYYRYSNNPSLTLTQDNTDQVWLLNEPVYWKDMKVEGTPQTALSVGLNWRGPRNIWAGIDVNYFDAMYLSMSPIRRVDKSHKNLTVEESKALSRQEMLDNAFVVNADISKSWFLKGGYNLGVSLQIKNLLNDKKIKTGGYEQMRLRRNQLEGEAEFFTPFDSKYYYLYGINYYLNVWIRF